MEKKYFFLLLIHYIVIAQVPPQQMVQNMGVGINIGNILSAPYEGNWAAPLTEDYIDNIARLRFKHVRIPIRFDNQTTPLNAVNYSNSSGQYIGSSANYNVNVSYLNRIEEILDWCLERNLIAIIDVHGDHWFWESFDPTSTHYKEGNDRLAAIDRFKAIWRDIAVRFQNKSENVLFEIMNEPFFSMSAQEVINVNTQILNIIRQTNSTRNVIVTGGGQNSYLAPMQLTPAFLNSDDYLIATFHYYKPFAFTSSASEQYSDNNWGTVSDKANVTSDFDEVFAWSQNNNIPIYLGEFGADNVNGFNYFTNTEGSFGGPNALSRVAYHQFIAQAAKQRGFASAVWDAGEEAGKTLYLNTTQQWVKDVRNAVLGSTCENQPFINNADIECNYDYNWRVNVTNGYSAKLNNSSVVNGYQGSVALHLNVNNSLGNSNGVVISNDDFTTGFVSGNTYALSCKAKGDEGTNFKFRLKFVSNGQTSYSASNLFSLSNQYSNFEFSITIPINTTQVTFQILAGSSVGDYFFDDFLVQENALSTNENTIADMAVYPNPTRGEIIVESNKILNVETVYNLLGQPMDGFFQTNNTINIASLEDGVYFLKIKDSNSNYSIHKVVLKR